MKRRLQLIGVVLLSALVMTFLLRDVVEQLIVRPVLYILWVLSLLYHLIPQPVLWLLVVCGMGYLILVRLAGRLKPPGRAPRPGPAVLGPVADLAHRIDGKNDGIYFKWQIAHNLGQVAAHLQEMRLHTRGSRLKLDQALVPPEVCRYLEAGLYTSFSDYPIPGGLPVPISRRPVQPTPFDIELGLVIDFLESEMENEHDLRRA